MSAIKKVIKNFARNAELDEYLKNEIGDAGYGGVEILKSPIGTKITLFVSRPGIVIGRRGIGIRSLTENIESKFKLQNPQISVLEIETPELIPQVMCNRIAHNVRRGTAFRRASLWALNSIMNAGALGAEISVAGKLRSERAHHEKHRAGIVLKSGETAKRVVREATSDVLLKMGLYGIKVKIAIKDAIPPEVEIKEDIQKETDAKPIEKTISSPEVEIKEDIQKETDVESVIIESTKSKTNADKKIEVKPRKSNVRKGKRTKKSGPKIKLDKKIVRRKVELKEKETKDEKSKK